jgi:hypothetical protein
VEAFLDANEQLSLKESNEPFTVTLHRNEYNTTPISGTFQRVYPNHHIRCFVVFNEDTHRTQTDLHELAKLISIAYNVKHSVYVSYFALVADEQPNHHSIGVAVCRG